MDGTLISRTTAQVVRQGRMPGPRVGRHTTRGTLGALCLDERVGGYTKAAWTIVGGGMIIVVIKARHVVMCQLVFVSSWDDTDEMMSRWGGLTWT